MIVGLSSLAVLVWALLGVVAPIRRLGHAGRGRNLLVAVAALAVVAAAAIASPRPAASDSTVTGAAPADTARAAAEADADARCRTRLGQDLPGNAAVAWPDPDPHRIADWVDDSWLILQTGPVVDEEPMLYRCSVMDGVIRHVELVPAS